MRLIRLLGIAALLASTQAGAQVVLNTRSYVPLTHQAHVKMLAPLCADMEKVTEGRVRCNMMPKLPVAPPQIFDAVRQGLVDLSFTVHGFTPGRFVLAEAPELPFMGESAEATSVAYQRVYEKMLAQADEHKGVVTLAVFTHGPGQVFTTRRAVNTLKDLGGLKVRVGGGPFEIAKALGAIPMLKPASESYELLASGIVDGIFFTLEAPQSFNLLQLIQHATIVPSGWFNTSFLMLANPAKWNQISAADQKAIAPLLGEALARRVGRAWDEGDAMGVTAMRDAKINITTASPSLIADIRARTAHLEAAWIEKAKPKGVDGAAVLKALRAEIATYPKR